MYLSAERIAVANKVIKETFEQTSIAWQAIPHWDTGDPAQTKVRRDIAYAPRKDPGPLGEDPVDIVTKAHYFYLTVAQAIAPTPDALLDAVIARTVYLAADVDGEVIELLLKKAHPAPSAIARLARPGNPGAVSIQLAKILDGLIDARARVENFGYRSPSCLLTNTAGLKALSQLDGGYSVRKALLESANVNSLYRVDELDDDAREDNGVDKPEGDKGVEGPKGGEGDDKPKGGEGDDKPKGGVGADKPNGGEGDGKLNEGEGDGKPNEGEGDDKFAGESFDIPRQGGHESRREETAESDEKGRLLLLGRRSRIAHGGAAAASPGEEPVDLAISSPPSLEVIGETKAGYVEFAVRIRFAPRITDKHGVVGVVI